MDRVLAILVLVFAAASVSSCVLGAVAVYRVVPLRIESAIPVIVAISNASTVTYSGIAVMVGNATILPGEEIESNYTIIRIPSAVHVKGRLVALDDYPLLAVRGGIVGAGDGVLYVINASSGEVTRYYVPNLRTLVISANAVEQFCPALFELLGDSSLAPLTVAMMLAPVMEVNASGTTWILNPAVSLNREAELAWVIGFATNSSARAPLCLYQACGRVAIIYASIIGEVAIPVLYVNGSPVPSIYVDGERLYVMPLTIFGRYVVALLSNGSRARLGILDPLSRGVEVLEPSIPVGKSIIVFAHANGTSIAIDVISANYSVARYLALRLDFRGSEVAEVFTETAISITPRVIAIPEIPLSVLLLEATNYSARYFQLSLTSYTPAGNVISVPRVELTLPTISITVETLTNSTTAIRIENTIGSPIYTPVSIASYSTTVINATMLEITYLSTFSTSSTSTSNTSSTTPTSTPALRIKELVPTIAIIVAIILALTLALALHRRSSISSY